jgi:hypothetical protein
MAVPSASTRCPLPAHLLQEHIASYRSHHLPGHNPYEALENLVAKFQGGCGRSVLTSALYADAIAGSPDTIAVALVLCATVPPTRLQFEH